MAIKDLFYPAIMPEIEKENILDPESGSHTPKVDTETHLPRAVTPLSDSFVPISQENSTDVNANEKSGCDNYDQSQELDRHLSPVCLNESKPNESTNNPSEIEMTQSDDNLVINHSSSTATSPGLPMIYPKEIKCEENSISLASSDTKLIKTNDNVEVSDLNNSIISECDEVKQNTINIDNRTNEDNESLVENRIIKEQEEISKARMTPIITRSYNDVDITTVSSTTISPTLYVASWHPHIYSSTPKAPTPHLIGDILGWKKPIRPTALRTMHTLEINQSPAKIINDHTRSPDSVISEDFQQQHYNDYSNSQRFTPGSISMSECSEDDSGMNDQPLNLCIAKPSQTVVTRSNTARSDEKLKKESVHRLTAVTTPVTTLMTIKRKKSIDSIDDGSEILSLNQQPDNQDEDSCDDSSQDAKRKKKARTTFTGRQIFELERQFEIKKYLNSSERGEMSKLLNVTETQVKIWFQNRRTKWKKLDNVSQIDVTEHKGKSSSKTLSSHDSITSTTGKTTVIGADGRSNKLSTKHSTRIRNVPSNGHKPSAAVKSTAFNGNNNNKDYKFTSLIEKSSNKQSSTVSSTITKSLNIKARHN